MAASKSYFARPNYRFLSGDRDPPTSADAVFELDESDIWNSSSIQSASPPPTTEFRRQFPSSRVSKRPATRRSDQDGATPASMPVNVPDWSKILKEDYRDNRRRDCDGGGDDDFGGDDGENRVPPHEFLARQLARTRIASYSVHEGMGRTLKGRDLSRVRNAIWEKTGFQD